MDQFLYSRRRFFSGAVWLMIAVVAFNACSKEGTPRTVREFTPVTFDVKTLKLAPVMYEIKVNDKTVEDSVTTSSVLRPVERSADPQRLQITEVYSNTVLLDTMIIIPMEGARYTVYQVDTTEGVKPLFIVVGQQESGLPADTFMQAFYVNDPLFPAVFDIKVFKLEGSGSRAELVHVIRNVRQKEFTAFFPQKIETTYKFEFLTPDGQVVPGTEPLDPENPSGGISETRCGYTNNYQVARIASFDFGGGFILYYVDCMFQY